MCADDTSLGYTSNSVEDITKSMNAELEYLRKSLHENMLTLNVAKITSTIIGTNRKLHQSNSGKLIQAHFRNIRRRNGAENISKVSRSHFG